MKKKIAAAMMCAALAASCLGMTACGSSASSSSDSSSSAASASASASASAPAPGSASSAASTSAFASAPAKTNFTSQDITGTWKITNASSDGGATFNAPSDGNYITVFADGTLQMNLLDQRYDLAWEADEYDGEGQFYKFRESNGGKDFFACYVFDESPESMTLARVDDANFIFRAER